MRTLLIVLLSLLTASSLLAQPVAPSQAMRFKALALACLHREYPNKISHVLTSDADVAPPRELTPVFYGCFDWHSAVHGHWLLVRLLRLYPDESDTAQVEAALETSFQPQAVAAEVAYMAREERADFERPYGAAWLQAFLPDIPLDGRRLAATGRNHRPRRRQTGTPRWPALESRLGAAGHGRGPA